MFEKKILKIILGILILFSGIMLLSKEAFASHSANVNIHGHVDAELRSRNIKISDNTRKYITDYRVLETQGYVFHYTKDKKSFFVSRKESPQGIVLRINGKLFAVTGDTYHVMTNKIPKKITVCDGQGDVYKVVSNKTGSSKVNISISSDLDALLDKMDSMNSMKMTKTNDNEKQKNRDFQMNPLRALVLNVKQFFEPVTAFAKKHSKSWYTKKHKNIVRYSSHKYKTGTYVLCNDFNGISNKKHMYYSRHSKSLKVRAKSISVFGGSDCDYNSYNYGCEIKGNMKCRGFYIHDRHNCSSFKHKHWFDQHKNFRTRLWWRKR